MHECHYKYILDTLWRPHYLPGDAQICDLLSSHFNNFSLDYFLEKKVWMLPMYSKTAPENSVLDAGGFAIWKSKARKKLLAYKEGSATGELPADYGEKVHQCSAIL